MPHLPNTNTSVFVCGVLLCVFLGCSVAADQSQLITKEPATYRTNDYRSAVPMTVTGARVIDSAQRLHGFLRKHTDSVLLDVYPAPRKPDNFPAKDLWIEPERQTLPGAIWLANTGMGNVPEELEMLLKKQLEQLTSNDKQRNVVIFCEPECWHSWNAAKRAASYGYSNIHWYRQGVSGWLEADFPVKVQHPIRP